MENYHKCPYCSRKIKYTTRLTEHGKGEHMCSHCNKPSNISQNAGIWRLLILCSAVAIAIMLFYLLFRNIINDAYRDHGTMGFLVFLFFGKGETFKWMFWELIPFAVFFFASPKYMEFVPLKRFMEQTPSKIDLTVPNRARTSGQGYRPDGNTRIIPKADRTVFSGEFEDISSSSKKEEIDKTKSFDVYGAVQGTEDEVVNVTPASTSKTNSYSSDTPLKKMNPEYIREAEYEEEPPVRIREQRERPMAERERKPSTGNYSGNRKF